MSAERASSALVDAGFDTSGTDCLAVGAGFADSEAVDSALRSIGKFTKEVDVVVNCSGVAQDAAFALLSADSMREQIHMGRLGRPEEVAEVCTSSARIWPAT